ncbi:MAG: DUF456 domain-containing protein [Bacteroidales bacterium]|nr:DUF456 domain-containing protein [Bacteroidales bacterium]
MNTILIIFAFIVAVVGLLGAVIPGLPGPPIAWLALLLISFSASADLSVWTIVIMAVVAAVVTVVDYVVPSWGAKKFGGSKGGIWGCNIGLVVSLLGLPLGPGGLLGIVFWPFLGAWIGELLSNKTGSEALRAAWGSVLGMLTGVLIKIAYAVVVIGMMVGEMVN